MIGSLKPDEIEEVLEQQIIGRIGFSDGKDVFVLPLCYTYDNGVILGHTYEGHKMEVLRKHPRVCMQVDEIHSPSRWRSVLVHGTFEVLSPAETTSAVEKILARMDRLSGIWKAFSPFGHTGGSHAYRNDGTVPFLFRINLDTKTGRFESSSIHGAGKAE